MLHLYHIQDPLYHTTDTYRKTLNSSGSIEIDHIDVSNLRRFSSRRNRIGSKRTNVMKLSVQSGFEYTFFALTLNPMGKTQCLEIEDYAGDTPPAYAAKAKCLIKQMNAFTLQAEFRYLVVFTAGLASFPQNQREALTEGSRTFNGVYTVFTYSNGIKETKRD